MTNIYIEYDGEYPNLCCGSLFATINGKRWEFPAYCMRPGGNVWFDDDGLEVVEDGPWSISEWPDGFPKDMKDALIDAVNESVAWGNSGGCV